MSLDSIPIWVFFAGTLLLVMAFDEVGYRLGRATHRTSPDEKEAPVSGVAGAVLGLTAFVMAFTFAMAAERFQARKELVRTDANVIRTVYLRADFLPQPDRTESRQLLRTYVDRRLAITQATGADTDFGRFLADSEQIQRRVWDIAVANARLDMNSDVAALYIESLNEMFAVHASRLAVGARTRIPEGIWIVLYGLTILGMISMGYHAGIAGSRRSKATWIAAVAFGLVIALIVSLDRPSGLIRVTQQPLADVLEFMSGRE